MNEIKDRLISLIFPRRCPMCDKPVRPFGELACTGCRTSVRYVKEPVCYKCGKPLDDESAQYCFDCERTRHAFTKGFSLFEYRSIASSIYRFKYKGRQEYAEWYGEQIADRLGRTVLSLRPQALIPVPVHAAKKRKRGYNQAALLAKAISDRLGIPVCEDLVVREKNTAPLKDHTPSERNNILRGAFKIRPDVVKLKTIMIIDDIYTTGATIDGISMMLRSAGVEEIYFLTLATGKGL